MFRTRLDRNRAFFQCLRRGALRLSAVVPFRKLPPEIRRPGIVLRTAAECEATPTVGRPELVWRKHRRRPRPAAARIATVCTVRSSGQGAVSGARVSLGYPFGDGSVFRGLGRCRARAARASGSKGPRIDAVPLFVFSGRLESGSGIRERNLAVISGGGARKNQKIYALYHRTGPFRETPVEIEWFFFFLCTYDSSSYKR